MSSVKSVKPALRAPGPTKHQKFTVETVTRSAIHGAPYNPRQIDEHAKSKLRANIKRVGLLVPILVNRRTGNVVSGHQRLGALDALESSPDYTLQVAWCELTDKQEREQNVFMNNESAMGSFDPDALTNVLKDIDVGMAGFDLADLQMMLPDYELPETVVAAANSSEVAKQQDEIAKMKKQRKDAREENKNVDAASSLALTIVFGSSAELSSFLDSAHIDRRESHISSEKFFKAVEAELYTPKTKRASKGDRR